MTGVFYTVSLRPGVNITSDAGTVSSVEELRKRKGPASSPNAVTTITTTGFGGADDGGGGLWTWDPSSILPDNGGTVVAVAEAPSGRWLRSVGGKDLNVRWFGAVGDGVTDDTASIVAAVAERKARGPGGVWFPRPPVAYVIKTPNYSYRSTFGYRTGAVTVDFSDVTFYGDDGGSTLVMRTPTGGRAVNSEFVLVPPWANDAGTGAPAAWQPYHTYSVPGVSVVAPNGHTYTVRPAGTGVSGGVGPADLSASSSDVLDGSVRWTLADVPYYGQMFRIRNDSHGNPSKNITFKNLIFDGDAKRNNTLWNYALGGIASGAFPWSYTDNKFGLVPAGEGYAAGHSAVAMDQLSQYGRVTFQDCVMKNWRSEIYRSDYGQPFADTITFDGCTFDSHTGNAVSCASPLVMNNCEFIDAGQAIENDAVNFDQIYTNIVVRDGGVGIVFPSSANTYLGRGKTVIRDFTIERLSSAGIFVSGFASNIYISRGVITDCATVPGWSAVQIVTQFGGIPTNVILDEVTVGADRRTTDAAFNVNVRGLKNRISNCRIHLTETAVAAGRFVGAAFGGSIGVGSELTVDRCDYRGAVGQGNFGGGGEIRSTGCRVDGLYQDLTPNLDPQWFDYYEFRPNATRTLTTPANFPLGIEVMCVLNNHVTIQNGASIKLAGGVDFTPGSNGAAIWFKRISSASQAVVETRRIAF